jgi:hypothetical protein
MFTVPVAAGDLLVVFDIALFQNEASAIKSSRNVDWVTE